MFRVIFLGLLVALSGCQTTPVKTHVELAQPKITGTFDPSAVAFVLKPGTATVSGEMKARVEREQILVPGKLASIRVYPVTPYSTEYFKILFVNKSVIHWHASVEGMAIDFDKYSRRSIADEQGRFKVFGLPAGEYYVQAISAPGERYYSAYKRITLARGQSIELALGDR